MVQNRKKKTKVKIKRRFVPDHMIYKLSFVFLAFLVMLFVLITIIYNVIHVKGEQYEKRVLSQQTYVSNVIPYRRGEIQDRNGTVFARSEPVYDLIISPKDILYKEESKKTGKKVQKYKELTIQALEEYFGYSKEEIEEIIKERSNSQYYRLAKELDEEVVEAYQEARKKEQEAVNTRNRKKKKGEEKEEFINLDNCIYFEMGYRRIYPLKKNASNIIGFSRETASYGLERYYNDKLSGTVGRNYGYFNAEGELERTVKPAIDGYTVVTTLDANVQQRVEKHIKKFQEGKIGSNRTSVVISNPQNGEIYAMASTNSYDLNDPSNLEDYTEREITWLLKSYYKDSEIKAMEEEERQAAALNAVWRNFCVSDAYEPGSTFKPITVSAVLEENLGTDKSTYYCDGSQSFSNWPKPIKCTHVHELLTMGQTIMFSCNDALMQMATKLGAKKFYRYERLFGLGEDTGVDLPDEASGMLLTVDRLTPVDLGVSGFGQSGTVTMMQMVAAFSSIINGGNYYIPHVMKRIVDSNGAIVETYPDEIVKKTVSDKTSQLLKKYLYQTVTDDNATAIGARVKGYEIGGKTGTAEKHPRGNGNYLLSFLGYVGYDKPQVLIYVVIDEPHVEEQAHSGFATEFAAEILKDVLPFLGIYKESELN